MNLSIASEYIYIAKSHLTNTVNIGSTHTISLRINISKIVRNLAAVSEIILFHYCVYMVLFQYIPLQ